MYLRARYYDMASGQFLTRDPIASVTGAPGAPYNYVDGNPPNSYDPSGLAPLVLYDINQPAFTFLQAQLDLYWKVYGAGENPTLEPTDFLQSFGRRPDLMWNSPFTGQVIAEVKAGVGGTWNDIQREAYADAAIVASGCAPAAVWHFYPGATGRTGPDPRLESLLKTLGIAHGNPQDASTSEILRTVLLVKREAHTRSHVEVADRRLSPVRHLILRQPSASVR